jgi:hypothetical protein
MLAILLAFDLPGAFLLARSRSLKTLYAWLIMDSTGTRSAVTLSAECGQLMTPFLTEGQQFIPST